MILQSMGEGKKDTASTPAANESVDEAGSGSDSGKKKDKKKKKKVS